MAKSKRTTKLTGATRRNQRAQTTGEPVRASAAETAAPRVLEAAPPTEPNPGELAWQVAMRRLPVMVWTTNELLCVTSAGGSAFSELALHASNLVGKTVAECFGMAGDTYPPIAAHRAALAGSATTIEHIWNRKAYRLHVEPLLSPGGELRGCVGMAVDITPRKHSDELLNVALAPAAVDGPASGVSSIQRRLQSEVEERRLAELALRESAEQFLKFAGSTDSTFWIYDIGEGRVIYLSASYARIWGVAPEEAMRTPGHAIWRNVHEEDAELIAQIDSRQKSGEPAHEEFRIRRPDGAIRWIQARAFPIRGPQDNVQRIAGIAEDVTRRKRDEEQRRRGERLATLGNFAAGIAHEMNNPLGAALASTQAALLMLNASAPARLVESLENTLASVRRCSETVKSLLHFCREESTLRQDFDLREVIRFAESITRTYAAGHRCAVTLQVADAPLWMHGNPLEMEIMLVNLVRNAIESGASGVVLSASDLGGVLDVRVADDGCGIADTDTDRICDPFFTTRRHRGGTGLGLSIVHRIVQELGGTLDFARNSDRGTTVCLRLPGVSQNPSAGRGHADASTP